MSSFPILDLVVGMIFVYFMLGIICSSAVEIVLTVFKLRGKMLGQWLFNIFDKEIKQHGKTDIKLGQAIMDHCANTVLSKPGAATSYIDAKNFTSALIEKVTFVVNPDIVAKDLDDVITAITTAKASDGTSLLSTELQRNLLTYANDVKEATKAMGIKTVGELQMFREKVEGWYDSNMDRLTGALKRKYIRPITFWLSFVIVILLNANSITIARYLYSNPEARTKLAAKAYAEADDSTSYKNLYKKTFAANDSVSRLSWEEAKPILDSNRKKINDVRAALEENIPLGWKKAEVDRIRAGNMSQVWSNIPGWLATMLAVMMGAPFWFDLLNKISNLRGAGPKPPSKTDADKDGK